MPHCNELFKVEDVFEETILCEERLLLNKDAESRQSIYGGTTNSSLGTNAQISLNQNILRQGRHCHTEAAGAGGMDKRARRKLVTASVLCFIFMVAEIVGGIIANSLAIATDAAHLLTDFASFMISLFSLYIASRPATKRMSFGWHRAEVMGALVSVLMIWVVTGVLVYMAIQRAISGNYEIDASVMLITAGVGVAFNVIMGITLHDTHGHSHGGLGHGHSHGGDSHHSHSIGHSSRNSSESKESICLNLEDCETDSKAPVHNKENINVRAAFIHVLGDLFQSIGVLVASYIIYYKPEWKIADSICTFLFSVLVLGSTITILPETLHVLMEGTPRGLSFSAVRESLCSISGVKELHNLRLWSLTVNKTALSVHLAIDKSANAQDILAAAGSMSRDKFGIIECTIQLEEYCEDMEDCHQCQEPKD